jgi:hypothetical protein
MHATAGAECHLAWAPRPVLTDQEMPYMGFTEVTVHWRHWLDRWRGRAGLLCPATATARDPRSRGETR